LTAGGCTGFRFAAAGEGPCGSADISLNTSTSGDITMEADGVATVGAVALDQYAAGSGTPSFSRTAAVQTGVTYLVQYRGGTAVMRITVGRNLSGSGGAPRMAIVEWRVLPK
jgi:hypothetical protein